MIDIRTESLARELGALSSVTRQHAWADDDQNCQLIHVPAYIRALTVAVILAKENPRLDMPVPGVDPKGHIWLTYRDGDSRGLALELLEKSYRWLQNSMGDKRYFESESLNDVVEAMQTVFRK